MFRAYETKKFKPESRAVIRQANEILADYERQGFDLTLRQLYYQFVARALIPNRDSEYKRLGSIVNDARMAGLIDWDSIVDRTRNLRSLAHWDSPDEIIRATASSYRNDLWSTQGVRCEVWIEKDALVGVIAGVCQRLDVPYFSCRGYTSQSEMWGAAQRLGRYVADGKRVIVFHLGDHDPSGIDMTRDIRDRLRLFISTDAAYAADTDPSSDDWSPEARAAAEATFAAFSVERLALNWDQVEEYAPPPNPAKLTDSRGRGYVERFGNESWELDALEPTVIAGLIEDAVLAQRDEDAWAEAVGRQQEGTDLLAATTERWDEVVELLEGE